MNTYRQRRQLQDLARLGTEVAGEMARRVQTARSAKEAAEFASLFAEAALEVQRAIALEARLAREAGGETARPRPRRTAETADMPLEAPAKILKH